MVSSRFFVHCMLTAKRTKLFVRDPIRVFLLVLGIGIISPFATFTSQSYNFPRHNIKLSFYLIQFILIQAILSIDLSSLIYSMISVTTPAPTVLPPSRMANRNSFSNAIGDINSTSMFTLSPGITISTPSGNLIEPVTSNVLK